MKKYIFTETQLKNVLSIIVEETTSNKGGWCQPSGYSPQSSLMKDCEINSQNTIDIQNKLKTGKFKVTSVSGQILLNHKNVTPGMIITPDSTIEICMNGELMLSGMGLPQCKVESGQNRPLFTPQVA